MLSCQINDKQMVYYISLKYERCLTLQGNILFNAKMRYSKTQTSYDKNNLEDECYR